MTKDGRFYIRVDAGFWDHPKAVAAGRDGRDLYLVALGWSRQQMQDGWVPGHTLPLLAFKAGIPVDDASKAADRLVECTLWERGPDGWHIHDYELHQLTKAEIDAQREKWRSKKSRQRDTFKDVPGGHAGDSPGNLDLSPGSETETETETELESVALVQEEESPDCKVPQPSSGDSRQDPLYGFDRFWGRFPRRHGRRAGKAAAQAMWRRMTYQQKADAWRAVQHYAKHCELVDEFPMDPTKFLRPRAGRAPDYAEWLDYAPPSPAELGRRPPTATWKPNPAAQSWAESAHSGVKLTPEQLERLEAEMNGASSAAAP